MQIARTYREKCNNGSSSSMIKHAVIEAPAISNTKRRVSLMRKVCSELSNFINCYLKNYQKL